MKIKLIVLALLVHHSCQASEQDDVDPYDDSTGLEYLEDLEERVDQFEFQHGSSFDANLGESIEQVRTEMEDVVLDMKPTQDERLFGIPELATREDVASFVTFDEDVEFLGGGVVGIFGKKSSKETFHKFVDMANEIVKYGFRSAYSFNESILEEYGAIADWQVVLYQPPFYASQRFGDKFEIPYFGRPDFDVDTIADFVYDNYLPIVGEITYENEDFYDSRDSPVLVACMKLNKEKDTHYIELILDKLRQAKKELKSVDSRTLVAVVNKDVEADILRFFGCSLMFEEEQKKAVRIYYRKARGVYYRMENPLQSLEQLDEFLANISAGRQPSIDLEGQNFQAAAGEKGKQKQQYKDEL